MSKETMREDIVTAELVAFRQGCCDLQHGVHEMFFRETGLHSVLILLTRLLPD